MPLSIDLHLKCPFYKKWNKKKTPLFFHTVFREQIAIFYQIFESGSSRNFFKCPQFTKVAPPLPPLLPSGSPHLSLIVVFGYPVVIKPSIASWFSYNRRQITTIKKGVLRRPYTRWIRHGLLVAKGTPLGADINHSERKEIQKEIYTSYVSFYISLATTYWGEIVTPGGTHILRHTGTFRPFGSVFCKKSLDMGTTFHWKNP